MVAPFLVCLIKNKQKNLKKGVDRTGEACYYGIVKLTGQKKAT